MQKKFAVPFVRKKNLLLDTRRFKENVNLALKKIVEALRTSDNALPNH
jgi:hypothetical protein